MKRLIDILVSSSALVILLPPMLCIAAVIRVTSPGPALYWSRRIGKGNKIFYMPKFRTMRADTPEVATHLLDQPDPYLTKLGVVLRKTSLDELPQLYSILKGDMSLVGPRPALHNQYDLIELRSAHNIQELKPGLTGWAQINGRDDISIPDKVALDSEYKKNQSIFFDLKIIFLTALYVLNRKGIRH